MSRSKSECPDLPEIFFVVGLHVHNNILTVAERTAMLLAELTWFSANNYWWTAEKDKLKATQRRQTMDLAPETGKKNWRRQISLSPQSRRVPSRAVKSIR